MTTQFSGLVMAYEDEQEEAFLTTQQVDEARHMQFFDRWFREVAGLDGGIKARLAPPRADVTDAFVELFDERLVKMGERLIADPSDMDTKVDFVTNYHMVIEGTLALTGQHFMLDYYEKTICCRASRRASPTSPATSTATSRTAPGSSSRSARRSASASRAGDAQRTAAGAAGVLVPKGYSLGDDYEFFGYTRRSRPSSPTARCRAGSR